ncbi:MAG: hypothetical protein AAGF11_11385 [Myxococcota bacterium]
MNPKMVQDGRNLQSLNYISNEHNKYINEIERVGEKKAADERLAQEAEQAKQKAIELGNYCIQDTAQLFKSFVKKQGGVLNIQHPKLTMQHAKYCLDKCNSAQAALTTVGNKGLPGVIDPNLMQILRKVEGSIERINKVSSAARAEVQNAKPIINHDEQYDAMRRNRNLRIKIREKFISRSKMQPK